MVRKKRRPGNGSPFGFGDLDFDLGLERLSKSATLANNKMKGRMAENIFELEQRLQGHEVKRIHKGGDFVVQKRDIFGRKMGKPVVYEIKTGDPELSDAQKRKQRRLGKRRYKVVRY